MSTHHNFKLPLNVAKSDNITQDHLDLEIVNYIRRGYSTATILRTLSRNKLIQVVEEDTNEN
jgi:hypothetical protein